MLLLQSVRLLALVKNLALVLFAGKSSDLPKDLTIEMLGNGLMENGFSGHDNNAFVENER